MNEKRFNIRKSHVIKNGWFIEDSLKKFTFPTSKGDKGWLTSYCKALNKLFEDKKQLKKLLECSREEANDYCEELMGKDEFIRLYKSQRDDAIKENEKLKKDRFICLDCEHSGYTEIGCLCEYNDHWQEHINECEDFKELQE